MLDDDRPLLLASASPRRRELLEQLGLPLRVRSVDVDETARPAERPLDYLQRIVAAKLQAALALPEAGGSAAVLVADTVVLVGQRILGKPAGTADAVAMLTALAGRQHEVATRFAVAVAGGQEPPAVEETVSTTVRFRALSPAEIARYVATGEGHDKAGAYAIQGVGAFAVERIEGSYTNVVGLPVERVVLALERLGVLGPFPR